MITFILISQKWYEYIGKINPIKIRNFDCINVVDTASGLDDN
jgi:hypothetical protein